MRKAHKNIITIESGKRGARPAQAHREFTAVFQKSGKWVVAWIEEMPGVLTQGKTMKEARLNIKDALALMLEEQRETALQERRLTREIISVFVPRITVA